MHHLTYKAQGTTLSLCFLRIGVCVRNLRDLPPKLVSKITSPIIDFCDTVGNKTFPMFATSTQIHLYLSKYKSQNHENNKADDMTSYPNHDIILSSHAGFHPIPLGVSEKEGKEKKKKKGKREKLWKIKHILFALLNSSYAVIQ